MNIVISNVLDVAQIFGISGNSVGPFPQPFRFDIEAPDYQVMGHDR